MHAAAFAAASPATGTAALAAAPVPLPAASCPAPAVPNLLLPHFGADFKPDLLADFKPDLLADFKPGLFADLGPNLLPRAARAGAVRGKSEEGREGAQAVHGGEAGQEVLRAVLPGAG